MFVKNKESIDFKYRKGAYLVVLKAGTVTYVDETKVTARELVGCYGQRIDVISRELTEEIAPKALKEEKVSKKEEVKKEEKKPEVVKKEELSDSFIDEILNEIKKEEKKPEAPKKEEKTPEVKKEGKNS